MTVTTIRRKLRKMLAEALAEKQRHNKEWGACSSDCPVVHRISVLREVIEQIGGRRLYS